MAPVSRCERCQKVNIWDLFPVEIPTDDPNKYKYSSSQDVAADYIDSTGTDHTPSYVLAENTVELTRSGIQGCDFCQFIWQAVAGAEKMVWTDDRQVRLTADNTTPTIEITFFSWGPELVWPNLTIMPFGLSIGGSHKKRSIEERRLGTAAVDPKDESVFTHARRWISECVNEHKSCAAHAISNRDKGHPPRLVDVQPSNDSCDIKLIECDSEPKSNEHGTKRYLALSYVWGTKPQNPTTQENYEHRIRGFKMADLPLTLQDAICVTRRLGYRYLWIDSICIIQKSEASPSLADWQRHVNIMDNIYANAHCTVVASSSRDTHDGMFKKRTFARFGRSSAEIPLLPSRTTRDIPQRFLKRLAGQKRASAESRLQKWNLKPVYWSWSSPNWRYAEEAPAEGRAWTFQERALSMRRLCFTRHGLYFECNEKIASESDPKGQMPRQRPFPSSMISMLRLGPRIDPMQSNSLDPEKPLRAEVWHQLVYDYSLRNITKIEDKLPAFAGLAREWHRLAGGEDTYLAGLWRSSLLHDLCWTTEGAEDGYKLHDQPSWSWAAMVNCQIDWGIDGLIASMVPRAKVVDAGTTYENDMFGSVTFGFVVLEGHLSTANRFFDGNSAGHPRDEAGNLIFDKLDTSRMYSHDFKRINTESYLCFPLLTISHRRRPEFHVGLVLWPTGKPHEYRRVGLFRTEHEDDLDYGGLTTTISII